MKRTSIVVAATALLCTAPSTLAGASAAPAGATASATGFVQIGGPAKLQVARQLKFPVRCSVPCSAGITATLQFPDGKLGPTTIRTTIQPGHPKVDVLTLNGPALRHLKATYLGSKLKVVVRARNLDTGGRAVDRRNFGFKR
jgi:hypothetical protein